MTGKNGAERRQALRGVQVGNTVTARGAAKTALTRDQKLAKTLGWAKDWTQEQRDQFIVSEKFEKLSDNAQEIVSQVFSDIEDRAYETSIGIDNLDLNGELPDVDSIIGDEEDEEDEIAEDDYEALFQTAEWEAETP